MNKLLLTVFLLAGSVAQAAGRPNVLFILADDFGWRDASIEGSTFYETPHIDRIARDGMRFLNGYAACQVCSPSRASIMTGKFAARHGITDWIGAAEGIAWKRNTRLLPAHYLHALSANDTTLAEAFQAAGYRTFFAGKWHLGGQGSWPEDHGFDINRGGFDAGSPRGGYFAPFQNPKLRDGPPGEPLPERLARETQQFIEANQAGPFLAYLSFYSVHAPIQTSHARWKKYRDKAVAMPMPDHRFIIDRTTPVRQVQDHPVYAGMVEEMDTAVGMVLKTLDRLEIADNTIVVFTSDNGGVSAGDGKATSNLPLRGGKGRQWEGGIREPLYIKWPGMVKPGSTTDTPATGADLFPTLLEMTGLEQLPRQHTDGVSLVPVLRGEAIPTRPLYWHYPHYGNQGGEPSSILREGDWKLIHYYEDGRDELYQLRDDPGEQSDLAAMEPARTRAMAGRLKQWLLKVGARYPIPNPNYDPAKAEHQQQKIRTTGIQNLERQAARFLEKNYNPGNHWWGSQTGEDNHLDPIPVAHRGLLRHAPENTLPAFATCLELGLGFELDIRTTQDGHLVVLHDDNVQRTTDGPNRSIRDMTLKEVRLLDAGTWFDQAFTGVQIPTLEETLALVNHSKRGSTIIALNIKQLTLDGAKKLVSLVEKYGLLDVSFAFDQDAETSRRFRKLNPKFRIGQNVDRQSLGLRLHENFLDVFLLTFVPTPEEVKRLHKHQKQVLFNFSGASDTRRNPAVWKQVRDARIDGLLTDFPLECRTAWRATER